MQMRTLKSKGVNDLVITGAVAHVRLYRGWEDVRGRMDLAGQEDILLTQTLLVPGLLVWDLWGPAHGQLTWRPRGTLVAWFPG